MGFFLLLFFAPILIFFCIFFGHFAPINLRKEKEDSLKNKNNLKIWDDPNNMGSLKNKEYFKNVDNFKNEDNLKNEDEHKIKTTSKMKTVPKMKTT